MVWLSSCGGSFICNNMCQGSVSIKKREKALPTLSLYPSHFFKIESKHHHTVLSWKVFWTFELFTVGYLLPSMWLDSVCFLHFHKSTWISDSDCSGLKDSKENKQFFVLLLFSGTMAPKKFLRFGVYLENVTFISEISFGTQCCFLHFLDILLTLTLGSWE